jgi:hypothetical protein
MKHILLTIVLLATATANAQQALVRDNEVVQTWRNSAPAKHRDYPGVYPFHSASALPDGATLIPATFAVVPDGEQVTSSSWTVTGTNAVQSIETEPIPTPIPSEPLIQTAFAFRAVLREHFGAGAETNRAVTATVVNNYFVNRRLTNTTGPTDATDSLLLLKGFEALTEFTGDGTSWSFPWSYVPENL